MAYKMEAFAGYHIRDAVRQAVDLSVTQDDSVEFEFNGEIITISASSSYEQGLEQAAKALGMEKILSREEESARAGARLKQQEQESAEAIAKAGVPTEKELRESDAPWPKTLDELTAYVKTVVDRPHDYGTCVYAMSLAAVAAFHYVCHELGTTGFQASMADLDILRRTRLMKGPFMIVDASQLLYPQYDPIQKVTDFLDSESTNQWLKEEAIKKLNEERQAHPDVLARWKELAGSGQ